MAEPSLDCPSVVPLVGDGAATGTGSEPSVSIVGSSSPACRTPQHRETGTQQQTVENMLEHADAHLQNDSLPHEGTSHHGRTDDHSLQDGTVRQRPELPEGCHLADHQCE